jgi:WD40 repeat protein/beta-lactamase regulating signal transducer with metallopeptidase domain
VSTLLGIGLANAAMAAALAVLATVVGRVWKKPALRHGLWLLVLLKLVTPPLVTLPILPWKGEAESPAAVNEPEQPPAEVAVLLPPPDPGLPAGPRNEFVVRKNELLGTEDAFEVIARPVTEDDPSEPGPAGEAYVVLGDRRGASPPVVSGAPKLLAASAAPWDYRLWLRVLCGVWLTGAVGWFVLAGLRVRRFALLLRHAAPAPRWLSAEAQTLATRMGLRRCPRVWLVPGSIAPLVWAPRFQAHLFFPVRLLARLNDEGRLTLLAHELAHVRRRDHWVRWLEVVSLGLYWWLPVVWWARRELQAAEEECCDAWVVGELPASARSYACAILETVDFLAEQQPALPPMASGMAQVGAIKQRLTTILCGRTQRALSGRGRLGLLALAMALLPWFPGPAKSDAPIADEAKSSAPADPPPAAAPAPEPPLTFESPTPLPGVNGEVLAAVYSPDGATIAVATDDKLVRLHEIATGRAKLTLKGQEDVVGGVAFSADGRLLATACFDGTVRLWDAFSGEEKGLLKGHTSEVYAIAFSPAGQWLATGSYDKTIRIWDIAAAKEKITLKGHTAGVRAIAFSPDGTILASAGGDRSVRLWDVPSFKERTRLREHKETIRALAFSPDGKTLASAGEDRLVKLWNPINGEVRGQLQGVNADIMALAFAPNGKAIYAGLRDGSLCGWEREGRPAPFFTMRAQTEGLPLTAIAVAPSGRQLLTLDRTVRLWGPALPRVEPRLTLHGHQGPVRFTAYAPDGKTLLTGGDDSTVRLWRADALRTRVAVPRSPSAINGAAFSPDGKLLALACSDHLIRLWDIPGGKLRGTLEGHSQRVWAVAFSPDGRTLASCTGEYNDNQTPGEVKLWDVATGKEKMTLAGHTALVFHLAFSPDGKTLATGAWDNTARVWDAATGREIKVLEGHTDAVRTVAFTPDGKTLATAGFDGLVKLWDTATWKERASFMAHEGGANGVTFTRDGSLLATSKRAAGQMNSGEVKIWDVATLKEKSVLTSFRGPVLGLAFSPDGKTLATGGGLTRTLGEVKLWDTATGRERASLHGHRQWLECVTFSPDGNILVSGGGFVGQDGEVNLWDVAPTPAEAMLTGHGGAVTCGTFSADGKTAVTGSADKTVKIWDVTERRERLTLKGHTAAVKAVVLSRDGKTMVSAGEDNTVRVWDAATGKETAVFTVMTRPGDEAKMSVARTLALSPDGKMLAVAGSEAGKVIVYDLAAGKPRGSLGGHASAVTAVLFSPDGATLVSGGSDGTLKVWDLATLKERVSLNSPLSIRALAFSPDGKTLAQGHAIDEQGADERANLAVRLWDTATWKERGQCLGHRAPVFGLAFAPDGRSLATASKDETVRVWALPAGR